VAVRLRCWQCLTNCLTFLLLQSDIFVKENTALIQSVQNRQSFIVQQQWFRHLLPTAINFHFWMNWSVRLLISFFSLPYDYRCELLRLATVDWDEMTVKQCRQVVRWEANASREQKSLKIAQSYALFFICTFTHTAVNYSVNSRHRTKKVHETFSASLQEIIIMLFQS